MKHLILAAAILASTSAFAAPKAKPVPKAPVVEAPMIPIDIKGVKLGMTKEEVQALHPEGTKAKTFTIAGVWSMYEYSDIVKYKDGKVSEIMFFFNASAFDKVLDAMQTKYPNMKCTTSQVGNRMGATFTDVACNYGDLHINKYVGDVDTSALSVRDSEQTLRDAADRRNKAQSDI